MGHGTVGTAMAYLEGHQLAFASLDVYMVKF